MVSAAMFPPIIIEQSNVTIYCSQMSTPKVQKINIYFVYSLYWYYCVDSFPLTGFEENDRGGEAGLPRGKSAQAGRGGGGESEATDAGIQEDSASAYLGQRGMSTLEKKAHFFQLALQ